MDPTRLDWIPHLCTLTHCFPLRRCIVFFSLKCNTTNVFGKTQYSNCKEQGSILFAPNSVAVKVSASTSLHCKQDLCSALHCSKARFHSTCTTQTPSTYCSCTASKGFPRFTVRDPHLRSTVSTTVHCTFHWLAHQESSSLHLCTATRVHHSSAPATPGGLLPPYLTLPHSPLSAAQVTAQWRENFCRKNY